MDPSSAMASALIWVKRQWRSYKMTVVTGMGLFTDAYYLFSIPLIMRLIGRVYYEEHDYEVDPRVASAMLCISLLGAVIGQLVFGWIGDRIGRMRMYGLALMLMVLSSIGCGFSICTSKECVLGSLGFYRFLLGVAIGGDYPLSATIMSEVMDKTKRGAFIATVFSMQGFGILMSSTVTIVVCAIFDKAWNPSDTAITPKEVDLAWRIILIIGAIPAALTYYWRLNMPETARYVSLVQRNAPQIVLGVPMNLNPVEVVLPSNEPSFSLRSKEFYRRHGRDLFACAITWLLVDVVFYSTNLSQSSIYDRVLCYKKMNAYEDAIQVAGLQAILAISSTIPGYFATVYLIDRLGRVRIQIMGFFFMAIVLFVIGIWYNQYSNIGVMVIYGFLNFFSNFGPNTTTFIVPAELFPTRFRATCHGISGAAGKVGAIIGTVGFQWAAHYKKKDCYPKGIGVKVTLVILGGVCIVGMFSTYLFTRETKGRSLDDNERDDEYTGMCVVRSIPNFCVHPQSSANEEAAA